MTISSQDMVQQLSGQLHLVSEIAESLTLRLLALEERFNELSVISESDESEQAEDSESFLLLADSSDRLEQLRGLLNERAEDRGAGQRSLGLKQSPILISTQTTFWMSSENFDLEQTVYVNDSQEPPFRHG